MTTPELTVEQALEELRGMFAGKGTFAPYITAGFDPDQNWQPLFVVHWVADGTGYWTDKTETLSEAMTQVRAWHRKQRTEEQPS